MTEPRLTVSTTVHDLHIATMRLLELMSDPVAAPALADETTAIAEVGSQLIGVARMLALRGRVAA